MDLEENFWEDEEEEDYSAYAYQGFGPVCVLIGCPHWGGDNLCDLAIEWIMAEDEGTEGPKEVCPLG